MGGILLVFQFLSINNFAATFLAGEYYWLIQFLSINSFLETKRLHNGIINHFTLSVTFINIQKAGLDSSFPTRGPKANKHWLWEAVSWFVCTTALKRMCLEIFLLFLSVYTFFLTHSECCLDQPACVLGQFQPTLDDSNVMDQWRGRSK